MGNKTCVRFPMKYVDTYKVKGNKYQREKEIELNKENIKLTYSQNNVCY